MLKKNEKQYYMSADPLGIITDGKRVIEVLKYPTFEMDMMGFVLNKPAVTLRANGKVFESPLRENDRFYCNGKYYNLSDIQSL